MKNEEKNLDKVSLRRQKTEKRLEAMKAKDGSKKPIRTGSRFGRVLFPITVVALALVLAVWVLFAVGVPQRIARPLSIGENKVGTVEYNYYYANNLSQFASMGLIPQTVTGQYDLTQKAGFSDSDETWGEVINRLTRETIQDTYIRVDQAKLNDIKLNEENQQRVEDTILKTIEENGTEIDANNLLVEQYGVGANLEILSEIMERALLASQFGEEYPQTYDILEDDVDSYYKENMNDFDTVSFRSHIFVLPKNSADDEELTDEQIETAREELKEKVTEMYDEITDEESFVDLLPEYVSEDEVEKYTDEPDSTLQTVKKNAIVDKDMAEWLFEERETGDKNLLEGSNNNFTVVYFISRQKNEIYLPTVRHILFEAKRDEATDKEKAAAKKQAEEVLSKISSSEDMEKIGDELVESGEAAESTLFSDVAYGQMVDEFNDWIFDTSRKNEDTDIVESKYGYHVMFFESFADDPVWYQDVERKLRKDEFDAEMESLKEKSEYEVTESKFGMKYIRQY